jgi:transcriptional regulator with XRE-family HTH domain
MGLSMTTFNRILANEAEPTFSQALRISRWLGVQVDELYKGTKH